MELLTIFKHAIMITVFVFVMMLIVDYLNVLTKGRMSSGMKENRWRQYTVASFLGATPGCLGAYLNVSFYVHGLISFGAIVGGMVATSGDEAFVMLALFPKQALLLFGLLFILGIVLAWLSDKLAAIMKIKPCAECEFQQVHTIESCNCFDKKNLAEHFLKISFIRAVFLAGAVLFLIGLTTGIIGPPIWGWKRFTLTILVAIAAVIIGSVPEHFLREHIWTHIAKKHLWRVFLWSFFAILIVEVGLQYWNLEAFVKSHMVIVGFIAVLTALVPESGPHLIFVMMFSQGLIPFSVLLASSIVQDGHGMLPLLSYSFKDSILIKLFNLGFGIIIGLTVYLIGW
ncbi:arsenic efflux protein [candidate division KSB1 bacterium]|nr:arsenic efflux protein [candidate division KSB1 bacterium]